MHRTCEGELIIPVHGVGDLAKIELDAVIALDQNSDTALARDRGGKIERLVNETEFLVETARPFLGGKLLDAGRPAINPVHGDLFLKSSTRESLRLLTPEAVSNAKPLDFSIRSRHRLSNARYGISFRQRALSSSCAS